MQGLWIEGRRPKSKAEVKRVLAAGAERTIEVEATSFFGNEYGGSLLGAPDGPIHFVGPDPHTKRNFYGTLTVSNGTYTVK